MECSLNEVPQLDFGQLPPVAVASGPAAVAAAPAAAIASLAAAVSVVRWSVGLITLGKNFHEGFLT